jgi:hypothetical protein
MRPKLRMILLGLYVAVVIIIISLWPKPHKRHHQNSAAAAAAAATTTTTTPTPPPPTTTTTAAAVEQKDVFLDPFMALIQQQRRRRLKEQCENYYDGVSPRNLSTLEVVKQLVTDHRLKYIYCPIPKVACTSWLQALAYANGAPRTIRVHADVEEMLNYITPLVNLTSDEIEKASKTRFKFMFVRHPFERLASAYREKLLEHRSGWKLMYYWITKRYRPNCNVTRTCDDPATFQELVNYLVDPRTERPVNNHWRSAYELCDPCQFPYDFIGHYETFANDTAYVMRRLGIDRLIGGEFPHHMHHLSTSVPKTAELVDGYLAQLTPQEIERFKGLYRYDFDLFGYF